MRDQYEKIEKLGGALKTIQQGMLWNISSLVKDSVGKAAEVFDSLVNMHKILIESEVEVQKKMEAHPITREMGILRRPRSTSLEDIPKPLTKVKKKKERNQKREVGKKVRCVPVAQGEKETKNAPERLSSATSGSAMKVSARDGKSYGYILKKMKARVNP